MKHRKLDFDDSRQLIALDFAVIAERFESLRRGSCQVKNLGEDYSCDIRVSSLGIPEGDHPERFGLSREELLMVLGIELP